MLSAITRSSYICAQCRCRILRNVAPWLLRIPPISNPRRGSSTFLARVPAESKPKRGDVFDDHMDSLVDSFIESAFSNTSLPPRPAPGIGKAESRRRVLQTLPDTWEEAGVRPVVAKALLNAYPNTIRLTDTQKRILDGLKSGYSIVVRDLPGTGKSFAVAAWILGLERAVRWERSSGSSGRWSPTTTAFIFVPSADLGIQYYLMIENLLRESSSRAINSSIGSFVQLLHRRVSEGGSQNQINLLTEKPNPHIIITTPAAAMDIISNKSDSVNGLLDFSQATAFVLDEFDALIPNSHIAQPKRQPWISPGVRNPIFTSLTLHSSAETLLDWVFKRRKFEAPSRKVDRVQPQLVLSSATLSTSRMSRFTLFEHPLWIGHEGKSSPTMGASPYDLPKASHLLPIGDESSGVGKIVRAVADNIVHHAVAYDISSGFMRDAPIPRTGHWAAEEITQKLDKLKAYEAENAESRYRAQTLRRERDSLTPMLPESWDMSSSRAKRAGYPPEIAAEALLKLLEHDKWPRNSIAAIGREASAKEFIEGCVELGIDARELTVDNWNRDMEREGRIPMGRTDMRFDPKIREYYKERNEQDACRDKTIVWVATSASARGLDVPGVFHLYVLHRLEKAREYTTYCGRVARWPFPTLQKDVKDPSSLGAGVRRGVGKVVSLLLEDHVVPASGLEGSSVSDQVIRNDGSDHANWSWLEEGLMVAKIGCHFRDYYGKAGEYSCGPEVWMPKPIRPEALAPTPSRTSNPLGATLGPDPLQEPSFSHPLKESSSGQIPGDLFELAPEQLKQASEKAQPEPSTNLPDLSDIWSLPFSGGSSKPAEELQQPTRSNDGDEANFWSNLKDIAPPPQTPGLPLFKSPQEDFRTDLCHAQERELSRIPAGANNAEDGYREPLKKSRRGQGRDSGRSGATAGVSTFDMGAVGGFNFRYKSPREEFRPDLKSDSERKRETEELSLTAIDAVEGYQEPPGTLKARPYGFGRSRMGHPKKSDQDWEEDFGVRFVPFREAGEELPGSEKEAEETREKTEAPTEEKKAPKEGKKASKGEKKASKEKKKPSEEEKGSKKKAAKRQKKAAKANPKTGK